MLNEAMSEASVKEVCFDEAGNTGQHLMDPEQPIFTTVGVCLSDQDLGAIRDLLQWKTTEELHFAALKRSGAGRRRLLKLYTSDFATTRIAKGYAIHKSFMVMSKIIDMLMEPLAYRDGIDLYERGANLATVNLLQTTIPVLCGRDLFDRMCALFVTMVRSRGAVDDVDAFYKCLWELYYACSDRTVATAIATLIASRAIINDVLSGYDVTELDPAIPAFLGVAVPWDEDLPEAWQIAHDDSKPIAAAQDVLECYLANDAEPRRRVGQGPRAVTLPLKATRLRFAASHELPGLQVADMFASGLAFFLRGVVTPSRRDDFWERVRDSRLMEIGIGAMWPSTDIHPSDLEMEDYDGSWLEASSGLVARGLERRYGAGWRTTR